MSKRGIQGDSPNRLFDQDGTPLAIASAGDADFNAYPVNIDSSKVTVPSAPFVQVQPLTEQKFAEMSPVSPSPSPSPMPPASPSPSP